MNQSLTIHRRSPAVLGRRIAVLVLAILSLALATAYAAEPVGPTVADAAADTGPVRFGFSRRIFSGANENDARVALKLYAVAVGEENGIATDGLAHLFDGLAPMAQAVRAQSLDVLTLTTEDFITLEELGLTGPLIVPLVNDSPDKEMVLLVHAESPLRSVGDLKGRTLILSIDTHSTLSDLWLDVLCRQNGLGPADGALARIARESKAMLVVLPVYFRQMDACIVTRNALAVMGELNPHVPKQLRILATSPPVVPIVSCFRLGFPESLKDRIIGLVDSRASGRTAFRQLLVMFKTDRISRQPLACLDATRELVALHRRLSGEHSQLPSPPQTPGAAQGVP